MNINGTKGINEERKELSQCDRGILGNNMKALSLSRSLALSP